MATTTTKGGKGKTTTKAKGGKGAKSKPAAAGGSAKRSRGHGGASGSNGSAVRPQADIPGEFGNVSIGQAVGSIGISIDPSHVTLERAHALFCGKRVSIRLMQTLTGEMAGQKRFRGMEALEFSATCDIKGYRVSPKVITARLSMTLEGLDVPMLTHFSQRSGRLIVVSIQEIPEDAPSGGDDDDDLDDEGGEDADDDIDGTADLADDEPGTADENELKGL
jgi:hypothetical protein